MSTYNICFHGEIRTRKVLHVDTPMYLSAYQNYEDSDQPVHSIAPNKVLFFNQTVLIYFSY